MHHPNWHINTAYMLDWKIDECICRPLKAPCYVLLTLAELCSSHWSVLCLPGSCLSPRTNDIIPEFHTGSILNSFFFLFFPNHFISRYFYFLLYCSKFTQNLPHMQLWLRRVIIIVTKERLANAQFCQESIFCPHFWLFISSQAGK